MDTSEYKLEIYRKILVFFIIFGEGGDEISKNLKMHLPQFS